MKDQKQFHKIFNSNNDNIHKLDDQANIDKCGLAVIIIIIRCYKYTCVQACITLKGRFLGGLHTPQMKGRFNPILKFKILLRPINYKWGKGGENEFESIYMPKPSSLRYILSSQI